MMSMTTVCKVLHFLRLTLPLTLLAFFVGSAVSVGQQWQQIGTDNIDARWVDESTIVVVGYLGKIMRSDDAGATWRHQQSPVRVNLHGLFFHHPDNGVAVGNNGTILRTIDGGGQWQQTPSGTEESLFSVDFATPLLGVAVGLNGAILRTTDGGGQWQLVENTDTLDLMNVAFAGVETVVAVGENGLILRSDDGGKEWTHVSVESSERFEDVDFVDNSNGVLVGEAGEVFFTVDGGKTWEQRGSLLPLSIQMRSVQMVTLDNIIVSGAENIGDDGVKVVQTVDGGRTWIPLQTGIPLGPLPFIWSVQFKDSLTGIAVGGHGSIFLTQNGGRNWRVRSNTLLQHPLGDAILSGIAFFDSDTGIMVGGSAGGATWYRTTDRGITWQSTIVQGLSMSDVRLLSQTEAVATGDIPRSLYRTSGKGASWRVVNPNFDRPYSTLRALWFVDAENGYVTADSLIYKTTDGGESWKGTVLGKITAAPDLQFVDHGHGYAVAFAFNTPNPITGSLFRTTNAGQSWETVLHREEINPVGVWFFPDNQTGFVVGRSQKGKKDSGFLYQTDNGGMDWDSLEFDFAPSDIQFFTDSLGFIVGDKARIMKTTNRGETWERVFPWEPEASDAGVVFSRIALLPDDRTLLICGPKMILRGEFDAVVTSVPEYQVASNTLLPLHIIPNPAGDQIVIPHQNNGSVTYRVRLFDLTGREVLTERLHVGGNTPVDVSSLPAGMYQVHVENQQGSATGSALLQLVR